MQKTATEHGAEERQVERVGFYSFLVNLLLAGLKAVLAALSGSLAITASAVDSVTDSVASLVVWGGLKLSTRKTRSFPYGLYKIENVIQVVIALFILFVGYEIAREIFSRDETLPSISILVLAGMGVSVFIPLLFGAYTIAVGKQTGSPALVADGRHRQADVLSAAVVLISVGLDYFGFSFNAHGLTLDRIAAGLVLLFVAYTGFELLISGMRVLLDASLDFQTLDRVRNIVASDPAVAEVQSINGRNAGRFRFIEAVVTLRTDDLKKAHAISERVESRIREKVAHVDRVLIHYEPRFQETLTLAVPLEDDKEHFSEHFGEAPVFYLGTVRRSDRQILEERFVSNPFHKEEKGKGIKVSKWLLNQGMDRLYFSRRLDERGPGYVFSDAGAEISVTPERRLSKLLEAIRAGE
jgi:cation diffusion facilitator family transporter